MVPNQIYERTLDLVAARLSSVEDVESPSSPSASAAGFAYSDLISTTNLELIANLSGCEAHRRRLEAEESACEQDLCFHSKFRQAG